MTTHLVALFMVTRKLALEPHSQNWNLGQTQLSLNFRHIICFQILILAGKSGMDKVAGDVR